MIGPGGRKVRCANCRHEWHADGPKPTRPVENPYKKPETPVSPSGYEIEFDIFKNTSDAPSFTPAGKSGSDSIKKEKNRATKGHARALAVTIMLLLIFCLAFTAAKPVIGGLSPNIGRIYNGFGLNVPVLGQGLGIDRMNIKQIWAEKGNTLEIKTKIINLGDTTIAVPALKIETVNAQGIPTGESWRFDAPVKSLEPQESVPITARLPRMPVTKSEVINLKASFTR